MFEIFRMLNSSEIKLDNVVTEFFPERFSKKPRLGSHGRENSSMVVSTKGFPSLSFECTKNSSSNENDNVLIFRVISEYRQL